MDGANLSQRASVLVIGAGIGGLAAAVRLAHAGFQVTVIERQDTPGGKMRVVETADGPVDTGPTVLTLRREVDALFADTGHRVADYVDLVPLPVLARHFWPDGSTLDLHSDLDASRDAIGAFAGPVAAREYAAFRRTTAQLFDAFDAPIMRAPAPTQKELTGHVMRRPWLVPAMAPWATLAQRLSRQFSDPRLAQLFGRYATYVGGSPFQSPALLSLISEAEARGVWVPRGGMHNLAQALVRLAHELGASFEFGAHVNDVIVREGRAVGLRCGRVTHYADYVLFNGDPRAFGLGLLGEAVQPTAPQTQTDARSLSANVWAFAATPSGCDLAHHNVFFSPDATAEWRALEAGELPESPTLYICAQDRELGKAPPRRERFEIIMNAPPLSQRSPQKEDFALCHRQTFQTLAQFGLRFDPEPGADALTLPQDWEARFPGSDGSLYGQSPHGMMAAFRRPTARTDIPGLYLTGGGTHPGAGVPMATRSGRHAAEAIMHDHALTLTSRPMAMPGGMSTE